MYINFAKGDAAHCLSAGAQKSRGLSALGLMATLAFVSVFAGVTIPAYQDALEKQNLYNAAHQVSSFLNSVMTQAAQRNRRAIVSYQVLEDGKWCLGATFLGSACNCMESDSTATDFCRLGPSEWVMRDSDVVPNRLLIPAASVGHFTMEPVRRRLAESRDPVIFWLQTASQAYRVELQLSANGRVFTCQAQDSRELEQYKPCSPSLVPFRE